MHKNGAGSCFDRIIVSLIASSWNFRPDLSFGLRSLLRRSPKQQEDYIVNIKMIGLGAEPATIEIAMAPR
ncbi:hypothetical protein, partial [Mesorhizobium sp. M4B.F.Ca.ET.150.01.1.1]|uniref:hypothetical protein n=1 Tax=Mesorhizobium sp. M4B.F.Ca.ET.150.01.1.1 TaxID=2563948 RepID=UPI001AEE973B